MRSFNSRTPGGVRHLAPPGQDAYNSVSIHAPREGCDQRLVRPRRTLPPVSIHAPREGCDCSRFGLLRCRNVSIHAPREGCDEFFLLRSRRLTRFQFTHPGRGATSPQMDIQLWLPRFNSRTPGGVRQHRHQRDFSAPEFQFTHPGRGATVWCKVPYYGADKQV